MYKHTLLFWYSWQYSGTLILRLINPICPGRTDSIPPATKILITFSLLLQVAPDFMSFPKKYLCSTD